MFSNRYTFDENTPMSGDDVREYIDTATERVEVLTKRYWRQKQAEERLYTVHHDETWGSYGGDYYASFKLNHYPIISVDKLEVFVSSEDENSNQEGYEDITAEKGRNKDWYPDKDRGVIYLRSGFIPFVRRNGVRIKYKYGDTSGVPEDIRDATAMLTAWFMLQSEDLSVLLPEGAEHLRIQEKMVRWKEEAMHIINPRRKTLLWA